MPTGIIVAYEFPRYEKPSFPVGMSFVNSNWQPLDFSTFLKEIFEIQFFCLICVCENVFRLNVDVKVTLTMGMFSSFIFNKFLTSGIVELRY